MATEKKEKPYSLYISIASLIVSIAFVLNNYSREDSQELNKRIEGKADKAQVEKLEVVQNEKNEKIESRLSALEDDNNRKWAKIETDIAWIKLSIDEIKQKK